METPASVIIHRSLWEARIIPGSFPAAISGIAFLDVRDRKVSEAGAIAWG